MKPAAAGDLIPGIPNDVAELCLLRLPFPHSSLSRSVSSTWNQTLSSPTFLRSKSRSSHLFTLAFDTSTHRLQWQALDPHSRRWFVLPPMPSEDENNTSSGGGARIFGPSLACAADGERGEIYVIGGMRAEEEGEMMRSVMLYSAASNSWRVGSGMRRGRAFFAAAAIGGRVYVAGGGDGEIADAECYDPATDRWDDVAPMTSGIPRYDAAVVGSKLLVTEGWMWPFTFSPRASVYDADRDVWEEMSAGMRDGWTGVSAVAGGTLFTIAEYGNCCLKAYDPGTDKWTKVAGSGVPADLKKPFAVAGDVDGRIYVVGRGLNVGVGSLAEEGKGRWRIDWEVVKGPKGFVNLMSYNAQVLHV